jgi:hypothetical protein
VLVEGKKSKVYTSFKELVQNAKEQCQKRFSGLIRFGFDPRKAHFTCHANYQKKSLHASFSDEVMDVLRKVVNHGDIRKIIGAFKKIHPGSEQIETLRVNKKEVVVLGEHGPSLMIFLIERACKKIEESLTQENKELRRLKKDIRASFGKVSCCQNASVKIRRGIDAKSGKQTISAEIKLTLDGEKRKQMKEEKNNDLPQKMTFTYSNASRIISTVNSYIQAFL